MIESRELISATRQLGSLTEAGVDILRAIKVLRAQTQNPELVAVYDRLAQELRLGSGLPDAMSHAPEAFSAFAVSIVRQGEARGDLATSFYRISEYLQKEREVNASSPKPVPAQALVVNPSIDRCPLWLRRVIFQAIITLVFLSATLLILQVLVAFGMIAPRWHSTAVAFVVTMFLLGVAGYLRHTKEDVNHNKDQQSPDLGESTFKGSTQSTANPSSEATFE